MADKIEGVQTTTNYVEVGGIPVNYVSQTRLIGGTASKVYGLGKKGSLFGISSKSLFG
jgi:hypothetical protein